ncbi:MAG: hypothetical protein PUF10_08320 [Bacteroidales bacterium]|nr:hypothetical protein [Bacteroidales bacterium]
MKGIVIGIIGAGVAILSLAIQAINAIRVVRKERADKLSLKLCNEIAYYDGCYQIKIINVSPNATAYNLHLSLRIKDNHFNHIYRLPDVVVHEDIYSINQDNDKEMCEVLVNVDAMRIIRQDIEKEASPEVKKLFEEEKLELKHLLSDTEFYLAVRFNAVNKLNGKTNDFPKQEFYYKNIKLGKFGVGYDYVTKLK